MTADARPLRQLDQLDADRLTAYLRRRCAWCWCSIARRRRDARCCSASCRCRLWRRRRALLATLEPSPKITHHHHGSEPA